jgi:pimeloyl-ACP methyl ester carboxylesterase
MQTLFQNSSVSLLSKLIGTPPTETARQLSLLPLAPPRTDVVAETIVLIHGAGASGLSYRDLATVLGARHAVYAIDDSSLSGTIPFSHESIHSVASECRDLIVASGIQGPIRLGGWSYGGVVALELAWILQSDDAQRVHVTSVFTIDSPLHEPVAPIDDASAVVLPLVQDEQIRDAAAAHFQLCTNLLAKHELHTGLTVPVLEIRAAETPTSGPQPLALSPHHAIAYAPGSHWSIVFGDNAKALGDLLLR